MKINEKQQFKEKVLKFLAENNIFPKRVRCYNTRRYGYEVRAYQEPAEYPNKKSSFRRTEAIKDSKGNITGWNGTRGHHKTIISMYSYINEETFKDMDKSAEEKEFILSTLKNCL